MGFAATQLTAILNFAVEKKCDYCNSLSNATGGFNMPWKNAYRYPFIFSDDDLTQSRRPLRVNENCFIRKNHKCGKIFGASKSCFIACPSEDSIEPLLELISEKLAKVGVEAIIAVKERAYGQDIFCTKICGKIIESKFCLVILDDSVKNGHGIPNPNVYYEYGLMTSLEKHIIPLQQENLSLAFNIQSYDTVKYNPKNIGTELDRAIREAIKISESQAQVNRKVTVPEKSILRSFELAGFEIKENDNEWRLSEVIDDTGFKGFEHSELGFLVFLGKLDEEGEIRTYLEDLNLVIFRTDKEIQKAQEALKTAKARWEYATEKPRSESKEGLTGVSMVRRLESEFRLAERKLNYLSHIYIGFIIDSKIARGDFENKAKNIVANPSRFTLAFDNGSEIVFGEMKVSLAFLGA